MVILVFRAITHSHFDVRAIIFFIRHSELLFAFRLAFRVVVHLHFGIQGRIIILVVKATSSFDLAFRAALLSWCATPSFRCPKPLLIFYLAFKAAWSSRYSEPLLIFIPAFKAMFFFVRRSESHMCLAFQATSSVGTHFHIFIWRSEPHLHSVFRAIICFCLEFRVVVLVRHLGSSCLSFVRFITFFLHSGFQSHRAHSFGSFKSFLFFSFGFQSHFSYPFIHRESPSFHVLTFRVISPQLYRSGSQSFMALHLSSISSPCYPVLIAYSS